MDRFPTPPLVRQRIDQARAEGARHLDLSADALGFPLPALPDRLLAPDLALPALRTLDLREHGFSELPALGEGLAGLDWLDCRRNPIRRLPDGPLPPLIIDTLQWRHLHAQLEGRAVFGLQILPEDLEGDIDFLAEVERRGIKWLSMSGAVAGSIPERVWGLGHLTHLDLSGNGLSDLPEAMGRFQQLTSLDLGFNRLSDLPEAIGQLQRLSTLDLGGNLLSVLPEAIGRLHQLTSLNLFGNGLSELPEAIGRLQRLTSLDLGGNRLSDVPEAVGRLKQLTSLSLGLRQLSDLPEAIHRLQQVTSLGLWNNRLSELPDSVGRLQQLTSLDLSYNHLSDLPDAIGRLQQLTSLDLGYNHLSDLPKAIGRLQHLNSLDVGGNHLSELPEAIEGLYRLTRLDLSHNGLSDLPGAITGFQQLTSLNLGKDRNRNLLRFFVRSTEQEIWQPVADNKLSDLPEAIGRLQQLTSLNFGSNGLSDLPKAIGRLHQLTSLVLGGNQLSDLPEAIARLQQLTSLDLSGNRLSDLPEAIGRLQQLTSLDLSDNQLSDLPGSIGRLRNLTSLNLSGNKLTDLPATLGDLDYLYEIDLAGNPLNEPLAAAYQSGTRALLAYLRSKAERLFEAKLLIVGEAGAGKTTLTRKLLDPAAPLPREDESTLGINVHRDWCFPWAEDETKELAVNIWDFGGQEIQYATHQFFLTPRALYVLVADQRRQETDYDYWFKVIRLLGREPAAAADPSARTPVLVLLHEKGGRQVTDFDLGAWRQRFPELAIETAEADLANRDDGRLAALRARLQRMLSALPHVGERQPVAWRPVRAAVEARQQDHHLSFAQFQAHCREHGIDNERDARVLARYLSFVGVCVYFDRDPLLKDFIITDPQWAVNALYRVLDRDEVQQQRGRLRRSFFCAQLAAEGYAEGEIDRLFRLLQRDQFELCFPVDAAAPDGELHIVPQLLPAVAPCYDWDAADNLHFEYQYPFMPKGLMARLIVRLHELLADGADGQPLVWRYGAVLAHDGAQAELRATEDRRGGRVVRLRLAGPTRARRALLALIRHGVDLVHRRAFRGLRVHERVPCNCPTCRVAEPPRMYDYDELAKHLDGGRGSIYCADGRVDLPIASLLEGLVEADDRRALMALDDDDRRRGGLALESNLGSDGRGRGLERLPDGDARSLAWLLAVARELRPQIDLTYAPSQHTAVQTNVDVQVAISIEQKNQLCAELSGLLANLAEDAAAGDAEPAEVAALTQELGKAQQAIDQLEDADQAGTKAARGPLARLKRLVEQIGDAESRLGRLIKRIEGGGDTARQAIDLYNRLAPFCGLSPVPNPFAKPG